MCTLVTIGIPFYNASQFLEDAIKSVINQTYTNWELILVDDGSTDDSLLIARSFNDQRIKILSDGVNKGLVSRLNEIILNSRGSYIARMDADDIMHFERIEKQINFIQSNCFFDVVGTNYYIIDNINNIIGEKQVNSGLNSQEDILKNGGFAHPTILGKKSWFKKNLYDSSCNRFEDLELWLRTVESSNFGVLKENLLFYRSIGVPTINKLFKTNIGIVLYLLRSPEISVSIRVLIVAIFNTLFKLFLYSLFYLFNSLNLLLMVRYGKLDELQRKIASDALNRTLA